MFSFSAQLNILVVFFQGTCFNAVCIFIEEEITEFVKCLMLSKYEEQWRLVR
jgi:hypothetical protein